MEGASNPMDDETDRGLIERLRQGDKSACAACVERYSTGLYHLALQLMGNEAEAEDVVQEAFLSAFKAIDTFEGRSSLGTWLFRITYNAAMMRLRRTQPDTISVDEADRADEGLPIPQQLFDWCCLPEQDFETAETRAQVERAIRDLPETLKSVFVLRELEGLSTEETAQALGVSIEVVKTRLHRARLKLRDQLTPYFTDLAQAKA